MIGDGFIGFHPTMIFTLESSLVGGLGTTCFRSMQYHNKMLVFCHVPDMIKRENGKQTLQQNFNNILLIAMK